MPEVGTFMYLAVGAILAVPLLGLFITLVSRPPESWTPALIALRERAGRRMKRMLMVIGFSFIAGGLLTPVYDLRGEVFPGLRLLSWCLMGASLALLVIVTPWIALYCRLFDVDPS